MKKLLFFITLKSLFSCSSDPEVNSDGVDSDNDSVENTDKSDTLNDKVESDYDMSLVDADNREEFKENLAKIEKEHGEQWDFCTCVVKNDSINKAFQKDQSDKEFDRLSNRFDEIDEHCKAFLVQSPNVTPEERAKHERKVKNCLKEAKIN